MRLPVLLCWGYLFCINAIMILFAGLGMLIIHLSGYIRRKNKRETP